MKIGILGTIWLNIPPTDYGGTEQVIYNLVNGLSSHGHEVTLFGPQTSQVQGHLFPTVKFPLRELNIPWTDILYHLYHITQAFDHAGEFDILHVHLNKTQDYMALPLALLSPVPVMFTFHGQLPTRKKQPDEYHMLMKYKHLPYTSISYSQRAGLPINFIDTIYNSINIEDYPFGEKSDNYLVWLGKVNPKKGTREAIRVAQKVHMNIYVMGKVDRDEKTMSAYYEEIKPLLSSPGVVWRENVQLEEKAAVLRKAKGLLNPIRWEEPFGLVMIEAQAAGTPVIALNRGAAPEVIENGKTGFVVQTVSEMVAKIGQLDTIKRTECRKFVSKRFSTDHMVTCYERAYEKTIRIWPEVLREQKKHLQLW